MTIHHTNSLLWLGLILVLAACSISTPIASQTELAPATVVPTPTYTLATPSAQQPAAGICASFDGEIVTIGLNNDVPDPRCAKIRPEQELTVINRTLSTLQVTIGPFSFSLLPGAEHTIEVPFGDYLEVGVHRMEVTPYFGAELWLEASK